MLYVVKRLRSVFGYRRPSQPSPPIGALTPRPNWMINTLLHFKSEPRKMWARRAGLSSVGPSLSDGTGRMGVIEPGSWSSGLAHRAPYFIIDQNRARKWAPAMTSSNLIDENTA